MTISISKRWPVSLAFLIASWPYDILAETSVQVNMLKFQLTCDLVQCRTPVLEIHENTGVDASSVESSFQPRPELRSMTRTQQGLRSMVAATLTTCARWVPVQVG